jgi:hypothetical protein
LPSPPWNIAFISSMAFMASFVAALAFWKATRISSAD